MKKNIKNFWIKNVPKNNRKKFYEWFNAPPKDMDVYKESEIDWKVRIVGDGNYKNYFSKTKKGVCLEIGFGAGRLMVQAAKVFNHVVGIDIHSRFGDVEKILKEYGVVNFTLLHRDQIHEIRDSTVDFVYSFIVFQHFDSMNEVIFYLNQINRVLNRDGVANIYYGRNFGKENCVVIRDNIHWRRQTLLISPPFMREVVNKMGFVILDYTDEMVKYLDKPQGENNVSGQSRILVKKK